VDRRANQQRSLRNAPPGASPETELLDLAANESPFKRSAAITAGRSAAPRPFGDLVRGASEEVWRLAL
jgi:hypothetical protein